MATKKSAEYDADSVKHLGSREAVQQKTAMYAGSTDEHGLFTCLRETTDNIIDEAINGYCTEGEVVVFKDLEYWVRDNGRGMPIGMMTVIDSVSNRPHKIPAIQAITSLLHAGGKLNDEEDSAYKISRGCFTGNTKVRLLNGKTVTFAKLYKRWLKNQTPIDVLTYDLKKHKLVPTKISNVILSKYVTETVTVHTSNGGKIECTPDHKFYTNTDEGKIRPVPAGKLEVGTSLVTTYIKEDMYGYTRQTCLGKWDWVHRIVGSRIVNRDIEMHTEMVHHESRVKTDNRPVNLEVISRANHTREHLEHLVEHSRQKIMETQADLREDNSARFTSQNSTEWHKAQAAQTKAINIAVRIMHADSNGQRDLTKKIYEKTRIANEFSWDTCVKWFGGEEAFLEAVRENYEYLASRIKKSYIAEDKLSGNYTKYNVDLKKNSDTARINRFAEALNVCADPRTATPREFNEAKGDSVFGRYAKLCATSSLKNLKLHVLDGKPFKELLDLSAEDKLQRMIIAEGKVRTRQSLVKSSNKFMGSCKARGIKDLFSPRAVSLYTAAAKDKKVGAQTFLLNLHFLSIVHGEEEEIKQVYNNYNCNVVKVVRRKYNEQIPVFDLTVDNPSHCFFVDTEHDWRNAETHVLVSNSHGVGQKLPNFLSFNFEVFTFSSPKAGTPKYWHSIKYTNGKLTSELAKCPTPVHPVTGKKVDKGTIVKFKLNPKFFTAKSFPPSLLLEYLQTSSYFTPGFTWTLTAAASGKTKTYHSENGALDYITEYKSKLPKVASMKPNSIFICSSPVMDVAVDFTTAEGNHLKGFTNGLFNAEGGDHVDSFFRSLQKSLEPYKKKGKDFTLTEIKEGVLGIVNAKLAAPKFSSQVKVKLQDERAAEPFRKLLQVELDKFFKKNKTLAEAICARCAELKNLRSKFLASKQVVMELRKIAKKGFPVKALMAPKCKASERELYLVEGDSAMGGITGVRNAHFQEVFPLKGKIMNAHRATSAKFFQNEEVLNILAMIGFDPKAADPYSNLRVSKLVFMTDADADGSHISVLLLSMVHKYFPELIERGIIYVAEVPEFMAMVKGKPVYADSKDDMKKKLEDLKSPKANVFHFKGLGEMESDVLGAVGMNPATRMLRQITPTDSPTYNEDFISIVSGDAGSRRTLLGI
jgi:DNA gyrase/topoisomerase IV subunit B